MYCRVINWMSTDVSEVRAAPIIRAMSETSVDIQLITRQYIPEDSELHTRRRENLKSRIDVCFLCIYVVFCAGRGLCNGLISSRPEESYRVSNCV
jgi:hypothetical protein